MEASIAVATNAGWTGYGRVRRGGLLRLTLTLVVEVMVAQEQEPEHPGAG
jgi:hypothetical protein